MNRMAFGIGKSSGIARALLAGITFVLPFAQVCSATIHDRHHAVPVQTGLDVLESQKFAPLVGKRVGLITNHTGKDSQGRSAIEVLTHAAGVHLVALFSPEHGLRGLADEKISSSKDNVTGLPVYSLYGETLRPTTDMLAGIDALVFDIQDAGVRFYTYTTTLAYCMEEAAKRHITFYVLDRPNPVGGKIVEGPVLDSDKTSFTAYAALPVRYALTIGELAQLFNIENGIHCDLHVIAMKNWHRRFFYDETGLPWIPPSPNLRTVTGAILYPGLEILQNAGVSVGRGTETPFEEFGAPWMNGEEVATRLNDRNLAGLRFAARSFTPAAGLYTGERCGGVAVQIPQGKDRGAVRSMLLGMEIASVLHQLYPTHFDPAKLLVLVGNSETMAALQAGDPPAKIVLGWSQKLAAFEKIRRKYLLYK